MSKAKNIWYLTSVAAFLGMFLLCAPMAYSQTDNYWAWAPHRGLDFGSRKPVPKWSNAFNYRSSSICDSSGSLLLYGDNDSIWDRNNHPLPTQCNIANGNIRKGFVMLLPKNRHEYYFFYTAYNYLYYKGTDSVGIFYALVDMRLNHGLGDIEPGKGHVKVSGNSFTGIGAAKQEKGGYWLLSRAADTLFAFPADSNGVGAAVRSTQPEKGQYYVGYTINPSNDNNFVVTSNEYGDYRPNTYFSSSYAYNFNRTTGIFSSQQLIAFDARKTQNGNYNTYFSCAFSPNDSLFYVTTYPAAFKIGDTINEIIQYSRHAKDIGGSYFPILKQHISANDYNLVYDVKLAPDGKIYFTNGGYSELGIIQHPDISGIGCGPIKKGTYCKCMNQGYENCSGFAFQKNIPDYKKVKFNHAQLCGSLRLSSNSDSIFKIFTWYIQDSTGRDIDSVSGGAAINYPFAKTGKYIVTMQGMSKPGYKKWYTDTVYYIAPPQAKISLPRDTFCEHNPVQFLDGSTSDTIYASKGSSWLWYFGDGFTSHAKNPTHAYAKDGVFLVSLVYNNGQCSDSTTKRIFIQAAPSPSFTVLPPNGCTPLTVDVKAEDKDIHVKRIFDFGNGQTDSVPISKKEFTSAGRYKISQTIATKTGCVVKDSFMLHVMPSIGASKCDVMNATVDAGHVNINWRANDAAAKYILYRKQDTENTWEQLAVLDTVLFNDKTAAVSNHSYLYKILFSDSCGTVSQPGLQGSTLLLSGENSQNQEAILSWNPYKEWKNGVKNYILYSSDSLPAFLPVANISPTVLSYKDFAFFIGNNPGKYYKLDAVADDTLKTISSSNILFIPQIPTIFIPNAFTPDANNLNDLFIPVLAGIRKTEMHIYNRWGELVFSSDAKNIGWNGMFHNALAPDGIYYYIITADGYNAEKFYKKGNLQLIK